MQASIRDLKSHLSLYIHQVENGRELIITSHNRPVAKLIPCSEATITKSDLYDDFAAELRALHKKSGKTTINTVVKMRKAERY